MERGREATVIVCSIQLEKEREREREEVAEMAPRHTAFRFLSTLFVITRHSNDF